MTMVPGLGNQRINKLLRYFESAREVFSGDIRKIRQIEGLGPSIASQIATFNNWPEVDRVLDRTHKIGAALVSFGDSAYPPLLRQIFDFPPLLWVLGNPEALVKPGIAVVGTRNTDRYGREQADFWASELVRSGLSVISGLAYGVDTFSHIAALRQKGTTAAVLGSGIDWIYPETNRGLAERIIDRSGAIVTEYPPGTKPDAGNFPARNRLVSGISLGVLVIQSGIKGGSMITARTALDQNREVFVVPHSLAQKSGAGNNYLIQTGQGKLICKIDDLLTEIPYQSEYSEPVKHEKQNKWKLMDLKGMKLEICEILSDGTLQIDALAERAGKTTFDLLPVLLELEMEGLVVQSAGKYFALK